MVFPAIRPEGTPAQSIRAADMSADRFTQRDRESSIEATADRVLKATTLTFMNLHKHGDLFVDFMRMRHEVFIKGKGWDLPTIDGLEFDQYDTAQAKWIAIHGYGEVLAGIRLLPTTSKVGLHSYMLRDAQLGLLDSLPRDMLFFDAPVSPLIWEATRLFINPDVPAKLRSQIQIKLMTEMARVAREAGATHVIGIVPSVFRRWMARIGMTASPVGAEQVIDGDKVCAALFPVAEFAH
ncbi:acyl-homoserine-lactone synthase [Pseudotabrizicola sp. L79]|uniref:acyl-homoserine-lactone synthase n=1 Tax=Pseudotabrizicola sp. L79 TaxID=3118402 RepID=UPI002F9385BD